MCCLLTANMDTMPAAEQDDVIDRKTSVKITDVPLSSAADNVAANFDGEWEQNVDDLVSWIAKLNL